MYVSACFCPSVCVCVCMRDTNKGKKRKVNGTPIPLEKMCMSVTAVHVCELASVQMCRNELGLTPLATCRLYFPQGLQTIITVCF